MKKLFLAVILPNVIAVMVYSVWFFEKTNDQFLLRLLFIAIPPFFAGYIAKNRGWFFGIISYLFPIVMALLLYLVLLILDPQNTILVAVSGLVKTYNFTLIVIRSIELIITSALFGLIGEKFSLWVKSLDFRI